MFWSTNILLWLRHLPLHFQAATLESDMAHLPGYQMSEWCTEMPTGPIFVLIPLDANCLCHKVHAK